MDAPQIVLLALRASIALHVFVLGLTTRPTDVAVLVARPRLLIRSMISMGVIMPVVAVALWQLLDLAPVVGVALLALSVSPVPSLLPGKIIKARGSQRFAIGLFVTASVVTIGLLAGSAEVVQRVPDGAQVDAESAAKVVLATVLGPLTLGMLVRRAAPRLSPMAAGPLGTLSAAVLALCVAFLLVVTRHVVWSLVGDGTVLAITLFVCVGLAIGHALGGPVSDERTVLAFATASRHPGVAVAFGVSEFADRRLLAAAVILYMIVAGLVTAVYGAWRRNATAADARPSRVIPIRHLTDHRHAHSRS